MSSTRFLECPICGSARGYRTPYMTRGKRPLWQDGDEGACARCGATTVVSYDNESPELHAWAKCLTCRWDALCECRCDDCACATCAAYRKENEAEVSDGR